MVRNHIGVDVHRRSWTACIIRGREIVFRGTIAPRVEVLLAVFAKHEAQPGQTEVAYEIGGSGFWLRDGLAAAGFEVIVAAPCQIPRAPGRSVKTDPRDSQELAELLQGGLLRSIAIPTEEERAARDLVRTRKSMVEQRTEWIRRVKAKLTFFGVDYGSRYWSLKFRDWFLRQPLPAEVRQSLDHILNLIAVFEQEIATIDQEIVVAVEKRALPLLQLYRTVPAFGPVTQAVLTVELRDLRRFATPDHAVSYVGLCPSEYSSGETVRRGRITRQGNTHARTILIEAAWRLIDKDPVMGKFFRRLAVKKGEKKAIVAVARKLVHVLWTMAQTGETYRLRQAA